MIFPRKRSGFVSPRRWKVRAWRTRRSFTWIAGSTSPISSRKTVPNGSQVSSQPARSWRAPVKAPRRWPNSSDSMRVGEVAEVRGEVLRACVEGDVAREADRTRHHLLARARRAPDESGDVVHAL